MLNVNKLRKGKRFNRIRQLQPVNSCSALTSLTTSTKSPIPFDKIYNIFSSRSINLLSQLIILVVTWMVWFSKCASSSFIIEDRSCFARPYVSSEKSTTTVFDNNLEAIWVYVLQKMYKRKEPLYTAFFLQVWQIYWCQFYINLY